MSRFADYEEHDATGLAALVRAGEVSPGELVEAAIERIEARNPTINAVVHRSFERARAQAREPDQLGEGPFRGVPFLLKDLQDFDAGQPATSGSRMLAERRANTDGLLVQRFKATGVIICGRTNTPEFGLLGVTEPLLYGPTRNPWKLEHVPGGSSGGAAAAVAAGMVPFAHASDGGGSIRIPAANCGLVGLKPSRYRIPVLEPAGDWGGLAGPHVVTRSVRDSASMLDAIHGPATGVAQQLPPPATSFAEQLELEPTPLRIALCTDALFAEHTDPACVAAAEHAAKLCESLGHTVDIARPRFDRLAMVRAYLMVVASSLATSIRLLEHERGRPVRRNELEPKTWIMKLFGDSLTAPEYLEQLQFIHTTALEVDAFFARYDVLITSTLAQPPLKVGQIFNTTLERRVAALLRTASPKRLMLSLFDQMARDPLAPNPNTQLFNMTGQPAISLPLSWHAGLPIGVQFAARIGQEGRLLRLARQLELAQPWFGRRAPLAPLA